MAAVTLTLNRITNLDSQKAFIVQVCRRNFDTQVPKSVQEAIVDDIDMHFYDTNLSMQIAYEQDNGNKDAGESTMSNFNYAMEHLGKYTSVRLIHATVDDTLDFVYVVVRKAYSDAIAYDMMINHSNGFHKQVPYQLYKQIHKVKENRVLQLQKNTMIERYEGWVSKEVVQQVCVKKLESRLLNTPFCNRLRKEGRLFWSDNQPETATGMAKRCYDNVVLDDDGAIYLGVIVEYFGVIPHAWLVKEEKVIERTPHHEGKQLYFGMEVDRKEYMQKQKNNTRRHDMFDLYVFDGMGI